MNRVLLVTILIFSIAVNPNDGFIRIFNSLADNFASLLPITRSGIRFLMDTERFQSREVKDKFPFHMGKFDFIIVGAGSAGATLAARLTENRDVSVLLIEAGSHETLIMDVPMNSLFLQFNRNIFWHYMSEPSDSYCLGMENRQCLMRQGKVLGGTSTVNSLIATRGNKRDYDEWAELTNDDSWRYDEMIKYFKKLESIHINSSLIDEEYRGTRGPMHISNLNYRSKVTDAFVNAGIEVGLPPGDYNGRKQIGFHYMQTNQMNGERVSTNRAYLHPSRKRKNLIVSLRSFVRRILIDEKTKTAWGVEYIKDGKKLIARARNEVIVTAGAIGSPKLLMLSGVGPARHLQSLGIKVLQDSPVGENLMDHVVCGGLTFSINTTSLTIPSLLSPRSEALSDYLTKRTGPFTTASGNEGIAFLNVDNLADETPNVELLFSSMSPLAGALLRLPFGITRQHYSQGIGNNLYRNSFTILPFVLKPKSRGKVLLRDAKPMTYPKIIPNYLSHPEDVRVGVKAIRAALELADTAAMQKYATRALKFRVPGCEKLIYGSDQYFECVYRTYSITLWHYSGTCKMGREDDVTAVVNSKLKVKGIRNLRIGDASIMPNIISGHANIPTIAIAEKLADMIKAEYGLDSRLNEIPKMSAM